MGKIHFPTLNVEKSWQPVGSPVKNAASLPRESFVTIFCQTLLFRVAKKHRKTTRFKTFFKHPIRPKISSRHVVGSLVS